MKLVHFLRNEDGQLTVDWTVLVAALMGVGLVVSAEVATGVEKVADEYDGINTGQGLMTMFVNNQSSSSTVAIGEETTTAAAEDTSACNAANPGNDKCVGKAGETPNGDDDVWGDGIKGQSQ